MDFASFDITSFIGMAGVPMIERIVEYLRVHWRLPSYLAPIAANLIGILLNVAIVTQLQGDIVAGAVVGFFVGFGTSFWHEISKR